MINAMKTLTKFFIPFFVLICLLSGCVEKDPGTDEPEVILLNEYTYKNESSSDMWLYILAYNVSVDGFEAEPYSLPKGSELKLNYENGEAAPQYPLYIDRPEFSRDVRVIVSNGMVEVIEFSKNGTGLYNNESYKLISTDKELKTRYYEYTFTDAFFENGTPIE